MEFSFAALLTTNNPSNYQLSYRKEKLGMKKDELHRILQPLESREQDQFWAPIIINGNT
jgi:hypothetical protein